MLIVNDAPGGNDRVVSLESDGSDVVNIYVGGFYVASIIQDEDNKIHLDLALGVEDPLIQMNGEYIKVTKGET